MLFKSLLATCCVALLSALIDAGPIGMDAPPPTTTTTNPSAMASSTPVDTSIDVHSTTHANPLHYSIGYIDNGHILEPNDFLLTLANVKSGYTHIIFPHIDGTLGYELREKEEERELEDNSKELFEEELDEEEEKELKSYLNEIFVVEEQKQYLKSFINDINDNIRSTSPDAKLIISIGGLSFGNGDDLRYIVVKQKRRIEFIKAAKNFMKLYGYNGIDFAWKYPSSNDRRGDQTDKDNYFRFVKEMHEEFKDRYTISIALPLDDSYIANGLNVELMAPYLDFITVAAYDINGPEEYEKGTGMRLHAAMKDVEDIPSLLPSLKNVPKEKIFLGPNFWCLDSEEADPESSDDESSVSNQMTFDEDQSVAYDGPDAISKRM